MAIWTKKDDITDEVEGHFVISDGTDIYYMNADGDIYHYDISEETNTKIILRTDYGDSFGGIAWFAGNLFFLVISGGDGKVYRYDNPGATHVATLSGVGAALRIYADMECCVAFGRQGIGSYAPVVAYTTDGVTWGAGSMPGGAGHQGTSGVNEGQDFRSLGIVDRFCVNYSGSCLNQCIMGFAAGLWGIKKTADTESMHATGPDVHLISMNRFTRDFITYTNTPTTVSVACTTWNMAHSMAMNQNGGDVDVYQFGADDWSFLETISSKTITDVSFVCMNDRSAYFIGMVNTNWELWERDEPLTPLLGGVLARFYHDMNTLTERFTLSFSGVKPGAMTLNKSLGTIMAGADIPSDTMAAYSEHPYSEGIAMASGIPTGSAITSVKWI